MSTQPTAPPSSDQAALDAGIAKINAGNSNGKDITIPLWRTRSSRVAGGVKARTGQRGPDDTPSAGDTSSGTAMQPDQSSITVKTVSDASRAAMAAFLDMSDSDKREFIKLAQSVGSLGRVVDGQTLANAWVKAVTQAADYNSGKTSDKWISPWEAVSKLALKDAAGNGASMDQTSIVRNIKQFTEGDLHGNADQILQQELGRRATPAELKAFTIAVNAASVQSPSVTTTQQTLNGTTNPDGTTASTGGGTSNSVTSGGYSANDANQTILDQVRGTPEDNRYQAAGVYFPALLKALGAMA